MRIAVVGCLHGELDRVYQDIRASEQRDGCPVDLVLVCGDFQSVRNEHDLQCMAVPPKYRQLGQFHDYYYGRKKAPILTLFIGGNHEASNYLSTLAYGGWVAENMYYMGYASVLSFGGLRIAGVSGIYKFHDSSAGHYEVLPFDGNSLRSVFHIRHLEIHRMRMIDNQSVEQPIDIFLSHDWPQNIHANATPQAQQQLRRKKQHFVQEMDEMRLGNKLFQPLLNHLKPRHWFSAHLHVRFEAMIDWSDTAVTNFLALDKCLPGRKYLEIIDVVPRVPGPKVLSYDAEWMAILRKSDQLLSVDRSGGTSRLFPAAVVDPVSKEEVEAVQKLWPDGLSVPFNFTHAEPALLDKDTDPGRRRSFVNPQTTDFCRKISITDPIAKILSLSVQLQNPDEINLDEDEEEEEVSDRNKRLKSEADVRLETGALFVIDKTGASS